MSGDGYQEIRATSVGGRPYFEPAYKQAAQKVTSNISTRDVPDAPDISPQLRAKLRALEGQLLALSRQVGHMGAELKVAIALAERMRG